jgi:hypothetical protein
MNTRVATCLKSGKPQQVAKDLCAELTRQLGGATPELVVVFASPSQPLETLAPALAQAFPKATLLGASTAGEFTEKGDAKGSAAALAMAGDFKVFAGMGAALKKDPEAAITAAVAGIPKTCEGLSHRTGVLLLDPLAGNAEETTLLAVSKLGDMPFAGGAAGDDLAMKATHVCLGTRVASDAVVAAVIYSKKPFGVGACHGHQPLSKPLKVTRAEGGTVHEIDGRPAWQVWKENTRAAAPTDPDTLKPDQVGGFLLRYEAGLASGKEMKVRAPLSLTGDSINFACGIPTGAVIRITDGTPERQVESAREAARRACAKMGAKPAGALVFDCICRNLILGKQFTTAVAAVAQELGKVPLAGFETYGEIAMDVGDMSGFHNTTTVVLAIPE